MLEYPLDIQIIKSTVSAWLGIRLVARAKRRLAFRHAQPLADWLAERKKTDNFPWSQGHKPNF